jgi:(p)ppGpp synthase/HD superfamily hydrolase
MKSMFTQELSLWRLRVTADADPGVVARVVERFQNLNVLPRRVFAEADSNNRFSIEVDVFGLAATQMSMVAAKLRQNTSVLNVYWYRP